eukprot:g3534.t1
MATHELGVVKDELRDRVTANSALVDRMLELEAIRKAYYDYEEPQVDEIVLENTSTETKSPTVANDAPRELTRDEDLELQWIKRQLPKQLKMQQLLVEEAFSISQSELDRITLELRNEKARVKLLKQWFESRSFEREMHIHALSLHKKSVNRYKIDMANGERVDRFDELRLKDAKLESSIRYRQSIERKRAMDAIQVVLEINSSSAIRWDEKVVYIYRRIADTHEATVKRSALLQRTFRLPQWRKLLRSKPWTLDKPADITSIPAEITTFRDTLRTRQYLLTGKKERRDKERALRKKREEEEAARLLKEAEEKQAQEKELLEDQGDVVASVMQKQLKLKVSKATVKKRMHDWWYAKKIKREKEMDLMEKFIRNSQKNTVGYIEGFRDFKITVGKKESADFMQKQEALAAEEKPHFRQYMRNVGRQIPIYIWYQITIDPKEHITGLKFANFSENGAEYINLEEKGWQRRDHPLLTGAAGSPDFCLWIKKRGKRPIVKFEASFNPADENELTIKGFTQLSFDFGVAGLPPGVFMWIKSQGRKEKAVQKNENVKVLEKRIAGYQEIVEAQPNNDSIRKKLLEAQVDLIQAKKARKEAQAKGVNDTVKFLGLEAKHLEELMMHFRKIDFDNSGEIELSEFFLYIKVAETDYGNLLFKWFDDDSDGSLNFNEFLLAISTYGMFGDREILNQLYTMIDMDGNGFITMDEFHDCLDILHGDEPLGDIAVDKADTMIRDMISVPNKILFENMLTVHKRSPNLFFPAFHMQNAICSKFLGKRFWEDKKNLFNATRKRIKDNLMLADERAKKQREKEERMKQRIAAGLHPLTYVERIQGLRDMSITDHAKVAKDGAIKFAKVVKTVYDSRQEIYDTVRDRATDAKEKLRTMTGAQLRENLMKASVAVQKKVLKRQQVTDKGEEDSSEEELDSEDELNNYKVKKLVNEINEEKIREFEIAEKKKMDSENSQTRAVLRAERQIKKFKMVGKKMACRVVKHVGKWDRDEGCDMIKGKFCEKRFCKHRYYYSWSCCMSRDQTSKYCMGEAATAAAAVLLESELMEAKAQMEEQKV